MNFSYSVAQYFNDISSPNPENTYIFTNMYKLQRKINTMRPMSNAEWENI